MKETETLELKKSTSELREAVISIASILNKHGSGELYFGIKNDGTVAGLQVSEKTIRDVSQAIAEGIEPKIYPKIEKVNIENMDCIIVSFSGEKPPYFAFGRAYMRVGDEDRQLAVSEIEKLVLAKNKENIQWDKQVSECTLDDIDIDVVREFVKKANMAGRIDFSFQDVKITLTKLSMIKNGKILRTAQVLFSSKNPVKVQAAVFAGTEKLTFLDIQQFEGQNIFQLLKTCEEYVKKHIMWRVKFGKLEREEIPEIPIDALREALVNSLCHRDYYSPQSNYIAIYKDRIEIDNPGTFPENLEPEDYIFKNEPSIPRNPLIAEALYRTKDIERWGSGLKRIYDECKENDVKVEFKKMTAGFKIIFYRRVERVPEKVTVKVPEKVTENQQKILSKIEAHPTITIAELSKSVGISERKIKSNISKLKKKGLLKRIGPDKGGHWEVVK
jgi:ATP-dependent DNA helicase RecG